jgi:iron complex outermembrane receptor protein
MFGKLDWVAGFFYLNTEIEISILERLDFGFDGTFDPFTTADVYSYSGDFGFITNSTPERDSTSFYGQGTWNHSDSLRTVFGLRHTNDEVYSAVTNFYGRSGTDILETDGNKVTGRLVVEKDIDDNTMLFGSFTRGY